MTSTQAAAVTSVVTTNVPLNTTIKDFKLLQKIGKTHNHV